MNLADITTKCYILALIIRDDGERLLLGDGAYEFKDSQQHFIANTYANDVVELQGTDGQMLAGQVRRTATQTFAGYIGDATFSKQKIEAARRDFLMFFRKKHYYTAVYVFSDGTAIQRDRGYIVNAPSVPELYQRFPEWSVGLNFEDPNYYEYAEDDLGHEIAAHKVELELSTAMSGGLIWDGDGAVSDDLSYVGTEIPGEGKNFQLADTGTATLKSAELLGDAEQDGTPTPDSPVPVQTVTGEQTVKIAQQGKNIADPQTFIDWVNRTYGLCQIYGWGSDATRPAYGDFNGRANTVRYAGSTLYSSRGSMTNPTYDEAVVVYEGIFEEGKQYTFSADVYSTASNGAPNLCFNYTDGTVKYFNTGAQNQWNHLSTTSGVGKTVKNVAISYQSSVDAYIDLDTLQIEEGTQATSYKPFISQRLKVNLGKNLLQPLTGLTNSGLTGVMNADGSVTATGTATGTYSFITDNSSQVLPAGTYVYSDGLNSSSAFRGMLQLRLADNTTQTVDLRGQGAGRSFTLTQPTSKVQVYVSGLTAGTTYDFTIYPMIEKGTTPSGAYAPYFTPIELCKIGDYQDRIYKSEGKWYIEKQVGKVVLDGTENWTLGYTGTPNFMYVLSNVGGDAEPSSGQISRLLKSNYGTDGNVGATNTDEGILIIVSTAQLRVRYGSELSIDAWKAKLASNNMILYYALATPTDTVITNSELIGQLERLRHAHTYADITNFSITATSPNLPAFLKVVAFGDDAIPQGGYVWEDGGTGGATTITVDGVDNAQPIWTVVGPATNPSLTNITTGESIQWTGVVPNGQTLVVNMADMTASLSGANVFEFISGSWITLQAGNNRVSYSATAATGIATLEWNGVVG